MMRKLATIRCIDALDPIEGADAIECATIGGWKVVAQKGLYEVGDLAVYFEIDSWIPHEIAPFLSKGKEPREYNGIKGERLRTVKLRGQLSQGLLIPIKELYGALLGLNDHFDGQDVTEVLGIQKWEAPIPACLSGKVRGNFPSAVPKTDQERIQNLKKELEEWKVRGLTFELTEKLDGSSCTMYLDHEDVFHVCSRNLDLERDEYNSFWKVAIAYDVEAQMRKHGLRGVAVQGELIGEGVQGNPYNILGQDFRLYDIYEVSAQAYMDCFRRGYYTRLLGLSHVPVLQSIWKLTPGISTYDLLLQAEGKSTLNPFAEREGIVFKCMENPNVSFKAISNKFLIRGGD